MGKTWQVTRLKHLRVLVVGFLSLFGAGMLFTNTYPLYDQGGVYGDYQVSYHAKLTTEQVTAPTKFATVPYSSTVANTQQEGTSEDDVEDDAEIQEAINSLSENLPRPVRLESKLPPLQKRFTKMLTSSVPSGGRLGNQMFVYASMCGIASQNFMFPVLDSSNALYDFFQLSAKRVDLYQEKGSWLVYEEPFHATFYDQVFYLNYDYDIHLHGFFQSWKYFDKIKANIRKQFTFADWIQNSASKFLRETRKQFGNHYNGTARGKVKFVGIHVRRGDLLLFENIESGYTSASSFYFRAAMGFFEARYPKLVFVVCSDDLLWSRYHIRSTSALVVYSEGRSAVEDLAILARCNHSIISVGSFGWWAAWLANGITFYYDAFPLKRSPLRLGFTAKDYYPPTWRALH